MDDPPVLWHIELDDELADTKIIAEAWDAGGLYQVGYFPGFRWAEWNGRFRDDVRRFVKGDKGMVGDDRRADRRQRRHLPGRRRAADQQHQLHHRARRLHAQRPGLVQRQAQRGQRRGQPRRQRRQPELELRRRGRRRTTRRSRRCAHARSGTSPTILMLSQGVPMMVMGDEARQTQHGNNNAYCQDNEITWFDWTRADEHADLIRFTSELIAFRKRAPDAAPLARSSPASSTSAAWPTSRGTAAASSRRAGTTPSRGSSPSPWPASRSGAARSADTDIHVMMNMDWDDLDFDIPKVEGRRWHRVDRHRRAGAGRHPRRRGTSRSGRATPTRSRTAASWCSSRSRDAGTASSDIVDRSRRVRHGGQNGIRTGQGARPRPSPRTRWPSRSRTRSRATSSATTGTPIRSRSRRATAASSRSG